MAVWGCYPREATKTAVGTSLEENQQRERQSGVQESVSWRQHAYQRITKSAPLWAYYGGEWCGVCGLLSKSSCVANLDPTGKLTRMLSAAFSTALATFFVNKVRNKISDHSQNFCLHSSATIVGCAFSPGCNVHFQSSDSVWGASGPDKNAL